MAKASFKLPEEFLDRVSKLGNNMDEIVPRVLDAGGEVVLAQVRGNLQSAIGRNTTKPSRTTGTLLGALGVSPAKLDRRGNYDVKVGFNEPRRGGGVNAKIASVLEHGRHGQPARPFLRPARTASRKPAIAAMKAKLEEAIDRL